MGAQQRLDRDTEISLEEKSFLGRTPVTRGGHDAGFAPQADQRRREVIHDGLIAERIDAADQGLDVTPARLGLVVDGKTWFGGSPIERREPCSGGANQLRARFPHVENSPK